MSQKGLPVRQAGQIQILIGILILAIVAGGAYFLGKSSGPKPSTPQVSPASTQRGEQTPQPTPSPTPDETLTWKTYNDNTDSFTIKYPPELKEVKDCRGAGSGICFQSPEFDPTEGDFIAGTNKGIVLTISTDSGNINKIADIHCEERNSYHPDSCLTDIVNDKSTLHLKGGVKEADKLIVTSELLYIQVEPNKITKIGFFNTQKDVENQRKIFDQILSTFKFLP